ncbi:uncharacterized protein LOC128933964 [Melozone crissalis]|uniref:uncharacterized protein LOC128933964 n=1 Tax=Melozone crissalis TaxID=40204 RepID=UPI0023D9E0FD|nr:uncharacterized protein LOC128933964 [Melozone crissalis]
MNLIKSTISHTTGGKSPWPGSHTHLCSPHLRLPALAALPWPGAPPGYGPEPSPRSPHSAGHRRQPAAGIPHSTGHRLEPAAGVPHGAVHIPEPPSRRRARPGAPLTAPGTSRSPLIAPGTSRSPRPGAPHSPGHVPEPPSQHRAPPGAAARTPPTCGENAEKALRSTNTFQSVFPAEVKRWRATCPPQGSGSGRSPADRPQTRPPSTEEPGAQPGRGRAEQKSQGWLRANRVMGCTSSPGPVPGLSLQRH